MWKRAQNRYFGMHMTAKNNDYMNALRQRRLNGVIFRQSLHDIISYAQHFLPVKFFLKY